MNPGRCTGSCAGNGEENSPNAEAVQVGRIALWRALGHYDPTRGVAFSTCAVVAIARALRRAAAQSRPDPHIWPIPDPP